MSVLRAAPLSIGAAICLTLGGCGGGGGTQASHSATRRPATRAGPGRTLTWNGARHVAGVVDLGGPDARGTITVAANGRLARLARGGRLARFAPRYRTSAGLEPYVVLSPGQPVPGAGCRWPAGSLYALRLTHGHGITVVDGRGRVRRFVRLRPRGLENGIAFDRVGRFGHGLLVTATAHDRTTLYAIDCAGRIRVLTRDAPRVEGGLVVAPAGFGRFGGDLLAPDEVGGGLYAIAPDGRASLVVRPAVPHGGDVGIESLGIVPARYRQALVADRRTPHNPHPGDNLILGLSRAALTAAGVHAGDLLAVSEGGARTVAVTCAGSCRARYIAAGPRIAHVEGHVVFGTAP